MYNNKSDNSRSGANYTNMMPNDPHKSNNYRWKRCLSQFAVKFTFNVSGSYAYNTGKEQHHWLQSRDSPTISASTTATNLSSLESLPVKHNRRMGTLEENLRVAQPEIEPLQATQKQTGKSQESVNSSTLSINVYNATTVQKPQLLRQVLTALSVSLVSMVVGFVSAYTAPTTERLKLDFDISDEEVSWVGSLMPLSALFGGLLGGQMIEYFGRKYTILITDVLFMLSWLCIAVAPQVWCLYIGRCIAGFAVGIASLALPVYLGETIQPEVRGTLGLLPTAFGNVGILVCFVAGSYISWSNLAWLGFVIPVPFILLAFFIPETPRWYISKGREGQAQTALQWLRGKDADIQEEFDSLTKSHKESLQSANYGVGDLLKRANLKPLLISLGLMFFQQMSGINAVIFYTSDIFKMSGSSIDKSLCTIIVGIVNFVSTFIATVLIDKLGRKILLYVSSVSMIITLGTLGTYFYLDKVANVPVADYGWLPLVSFIIYVLGFSMGFGPIPWLMLGELFPAKIRGSAASLATASNWTCTFIVTKTFLDILASIGPHGTFWLFSIVCVVALVFVIIWVPETQGLSLQDIERELAGLKVRRMSSVANLKPMPSTF